MNRSAITIPETPEQIKRDRLEVAAAFPELNPVAAPGTMSEKARSRLDLIMAIERRLSISKPRPASILNMNPFDLRIGGIHFDDIVPKACPDGRPYTHYVIRKHKYDWADKGDDNFIPSELVPVVLAEEFKNYYHKRGGVVVYEGDHDPVNDSSLKELIEDAHARMVEMAFEYFREAEAQHMLPNKAGIGNIGDLHRKYTALLLRLRLISDKPTWLEVRRSESDIAEPCPRCKAEPKKGAYMCPTCGFIIDPKQAYLNREIEDDNIALRRLSRVELDELGLTEIEGKEEFEKRIAEKKKEPPKVKKAAN